MLNNRMRASHFDLHAFFVFASISLTVMIIDENKDTYQQRDKGTESKEQEEGATDIDADGPMIIEMQSTMNNTLPADNSQPNIPRHPLGFLQSLFLIQPIFHVFGGALALEVELDVVQGCADLMERSLWVEVGIALGEQLADVA